LKSPSDFPFARYVTVITYLDILIKTSHFYYPTDGELEDTRYVEGIFKHPTGQK